MTDDRVQVDAATMRRWAELALSIRMVANALRDASTPTNDSAFWTVEEMFPPESVSQWTREGLRSAVDHLTTWANHAVPLQQFEGQVVTHDGFRWSYTLMRGAIEGAAQSLWLSSAKTPPEAIARLVRMVRHDLAEQRLAWIAMGRDTAAIDERKGRHDAIADLLVDHGPATPKLPNMVDMVRHAARLASVDPGRWEANWRVCSAAAHGKDWAILELQIPRTAHEWRPGQFHINAHPDPERLTGVLDDTVDMVLIGLNLYLQRSGHDVPSTTRKAMIEAARATPQKDGGAHVERLARELEL
ncbi:hypothetical protein [Agromyces bauzanensis]